MIVCSNPTRTFSLNVRHTSLICLLRLRCHLRIDETDVDSHSFIKHISSSSSSQGMPGGVAAVPYYTFPGVSISGLLPGRVYSEIDRFQIILHCPQQGATGAASLALPSEGGLCMAACTTSLESESANWREMCLKSLRRRSRTKVLMLVQLKFEPLIRQLTTTPSSRH